MPVPLPAGDETELTPPTAEEVSRVAWAAVTDVAPPAGLTDL
jgi:hypothetical protein